MKWLLCLMLIGLGLFSYNQSQIIDKLTADLKDSNAAVTDLKRQAQVAAPPRVAVGTAPFPQATPASLPTPAPRPSWMNVHSDLDHTPAPGHTK